MQDTGKPSAVVCVNAGKQAAVKSYTFHIHNPAKCEEKILNSN